MASGKKKKKNMITLLSLLAVLLLLIVAYVAASKWKGKEAENEDADGKGEGILLAEVETSKIQVIRVVSDLYSYTLESRDGAWAVQGDEEFPLDRAAADAMAEVLTDFRASRLVLPDAADLSEYGLSEPALKLEVEKADGTQVKIHIGDNSSADGGYYTCMAGTGDVYLVDAEIRDCFYLSQTQLMSLDTVPAFAAADAVGLKVESDVYPSFTIKDSTGDLPDLTSMALYMLALYGIYEKPVRVDLTNFSTLMDNYTGITLGEAVSYRFGDLPKYGLSEPSEALTVWYTESGEDGTEQTKDFTIYFGDSTEDKSGVYVRLEGSNQVFVMPAENRESLLVVDTFSAISVYTQMVNITTIAGLNITYEDTQRVFSITHETVERDDGTTATEDYFAVDGKALDDGEESDAFRDIYQAVIAVRLTKELPAGAELSGDAVLTLTFLEDAAGKVLHEVRYLPVAGDAEHYAIEENGTCIFMADAGAVDALIGTLKEYQP